MDELDDLSQRVLIPPSITSSLPTVKVASSEAKKTTARAISAGSPKRPTGTCFRIDSLTAASSSFDMPSLLRSGVAMGPGLIAFTRMPRGINSPERVFAGKGERLWRPHKWWCSASRCGR